jgi:YaaC-like Protein
MAAARACGPASRALPLFYALRQAGQAITAAYQQAQGGQLQGGHGLTVPARSRTLESIKVAPDGQGSFQAVADATASPQITAAVSAEALWGSLPEGTRELPPGSTHPGALALIPNDRPGPSALLRLTDKAEARVYGFPDALSTAADRIGFLRTHLSQYPTANGWESPNPTNLPIMRDPSAGWAAHLQWRLPRASGSAAERAEHLLTIVAPRYDTYSMGWIRPAVGPNRDNPSPLMTWWALLYALSMLARYYPDFWVKMLDLDHSPDAAPLMTILDDALTSVPRLVLGALRRSPYLTA